MSESAQKLLGLAVMVVSLFMTLFGIYLPSELLPSLFGSAMVWAGLVALVVGTVLFVVERRD